jgi:hypothetical protein
MKPTINRPIFITLQFFSTVQPEWHPTCILIPKQDCERLAITVTEYANPQQASGIIKILAKFSSRWKPHEAMDRTT